MNYKFYRIGVCFAKFMFAIIIERLVCPWSSFYSRPSVIIMWVWGMSWQKIYFGSRADEKTELRYTLEGHALGVLSVDINTQGTSILNLYKEQLINDIIKISIKQLLFMSLRDILLCACCCFSILILETLYALRLQFTFVLLVSGYFLWIWRAVS